MRTALARIDEWTLEEAATVPADSAGLASEARCTTAAVNDDLNIPEAFAALFGLARRNSALRTASEAPTRGVIADRMDSVLGDPVGRRAYGWYRDHGAGRGARGGACRQRVGGVRPSA